MKRYIILTVSIIFSFCLNTNALAAVSTQERNALIGVYNGTDGSNWHNSTNWLGGPGTECNWYGVTCDSGNNYVTDLNLRSNNLKGDLPVVIGLLTVFSNLRKLDMGNNQLTNKIPSEIEYLDKLEYLNLLSNKISGSIPDKLGNLSNLQKLYLGNNLLTGNIPGALSNLSNLEYLFLWGNQLTGIIPSSIGDLSKVSELHLSYNQLSGEIPADLGKLSNLKQLGLNNNKLQGNIPSSLGNLTNLTYISLRSNQLSGTIPSALGSLTNLTGILLNGNNLSGLIPTELQNLTKLEDGKSDFRWNGLYTSTPEMASFLARKQVGNDWETTQTGTVPSCDINADGVLNLADAIMILQILSGMNPDNICAAYNLSGVDVNDDGTRGSSGDFAGMEEVIFTLNSISR